MQHILNSARLDTENTMASNSSISSSNTASQRACTAKLFMQDFTEILLFIKPYASNWILKLFWSYPLLSKQRYRLQSAYNLSITIVMSNLSLWQIKIPFL